MYIERVPNRNSPPAILLRESYRDGGRVRKRTIANLSRWPEDRIEALRAVLRGGTPIERLDHAFEIVRTRPHGHVAAVLGTMRKLKLHQLLHPTRSHERDLVEAMVCARILEPASKLATARGLAAETSSNSLGEVFGLGEVTEDELYEAMDWLVQRQRQAEARLAKRHLSDGTLVLYDLTSTYFEGRTCSLAKLGYSRDGKKGKLQIVFGLLCNAEGCPVAVEVFDGNTGDPKTLGPQIDKVRRRFGLKRVVFVGDRGMITEARIREDLRPVAGLSWITALRAPAIRGLIERGSFQPSLFDEQDLAEITDPDYPGERLIVCRNPVLAEERARKRAELLQATERTLAEIIEATRRSKRRLRGKDKIALKVGKVLGKYKMAKHFQLVITETSFGYKRDEARIAAEATLDGIYIVRTDLPAETLSAEQTVGAYKSLSAVEQAFRSYKTVDLKVRPIHHRLAERVRAHVFLCMLAYYVEWHMRRALAPMLFEEDDKGAAEALRESIVAAAERSPSARAKALTKRTAEDLPVHSFRSLLKDLATVAKNQIQPKLAGAQPFEQLTAPTRLQQRAFDLLGVSCRV